MELQTGKDAHCCLYYWKGHKVCLHTKIGDPDVEECVGLLGFYDEDSG